MDEEDRLGFYIDPEDQNMVKYRTWRMRDGTRVLIKDMTDIHLYNAIRLMDRKLAAKKGFAFFPSMQGEMAQAYAEQEYFTLMQCEDPGELWPIYYCLVEEAGKRKMYDSNLKLKQPGAILSSGLVDLRQVKPEK